MPPLPKDDLEDIVKRTLDFWPKLKGQNIFITGGTGFFGHWLVESFLEANVKLALGAKAYLLTRNINNIFERSPHLSKRNDLVWIEGDVATFDFPEGVFPYVIHAATDTYDKGVKESPDNIIATIVDGTKRVLVFAKQAKTNTLLYVSSGAVYGPQPVDCLRLHEDMPVIDENDITNTPYARGKVMAEKLCAQFAKETSISIKIVRCFAFIGPLLPLDKHFAIGNFIRDAINGSDIFIVGDGTPQRTYLYASDLTVWLWVVLNEGISLRPYNVGGDKVYTIIQAAKIVNTIIGTNTQIIISQKNKSVATVSRYVPSIERISEELNINKGIFLEESVLKTINWYHINKTKN